MKFILDTPKKIKNLVFDFGNVVMDIDIAKTVEAFMKLNIDGLKPENIFPLPLPIFEDFEIGAINETEFIEKFRTIFPAARDVKDSDFWDAWNILLLGFDPERIKLLKTLSKEYKIYILSNTNAEHVEYFSNLFESQFGIKLSDLFVKLFYSNEMGLRKPNLEIYHRVAKESNIDPSETLFIDDLLENVEAAKECGFQGFHLKSDVTILNIFK